MFNHEDEMKRKWRMHGNAHMKGSCHLKDVGVDGSVIVEWTLSGT